MSEDLYKVNVEVDVFVMASDLGEAAKIARLHAGQEIPEFGQAHASPVNSVYEIPEDWENTIPYSKEAHEKRTCKGIMTAPKKEETQNQSPPKKKKKKRRKPQPQPVENDLPVELPKDEPDLPKLRFKI